jgi:prepilin-type N-terminal cleavage/methylation domain-containing protein
MTLERRRPGFSLTEVLVVAAVVALLAMLAIPALSRLPPAQRMRGEAQNAAAFARQARLKAASSQKPVRVVLECPPDRAAPCRLTMEAAVYSLGQVTDWVRVPNGGREMARQISARPAAAPPYKGDSDRAREGVFWAIFMPNGRIFSFPSPFDLVFNADDLRGNWPNWRLTVDRGSGRAAVCARRPGRDDGC